MKNLLEIARIVTKKKVRKIEIFDDYHLRNKNSKFNEFYEALSSERFTDDEDAAQQLYQCSPQDARYRQLKSRFRRRLLNTLFFLDVNQPAASSYERAHHTCHREWTLVKILQENQADGSAAALAKSILSTALKFHLTEIIVNCARLLRQYAAQQGEPREFTYYNDLVTSYGATLAAETQAEEYAQEIELIYRQPHRPDDAQRNRVDTHCLRLLDVSERFPGSPVIQYSSFLAWVMRYEIAGEYAFVLEVCDRAEHYLDEHPDFYQEDKLIVFFTRRMSAYLHLRDYRNGQLNAEKCLARFPTGSPTWFHFMEYYLLLALHTGYYLQATAIFNLAVDNRGFQQLDPSQKEKWQLFEKYLHFLTRQSQVELHLSPVRPNEPFVLEKYLDWTPRYPREERLFTLLHRFLQVAFLIDLKAYSRATPQIRELRHMANRQLDKEEFARPIQFIRLLQGLESVDYQPERVPDAGKQVRVLEDRPMRYRGAPSQLEVLPYHQFYEEILRRLR